MSKYSELADRLDATMHGMSEEAAALRELEAEVERLRGLLRELLDADTHSDCLPFSGNCPRCVAGNEARAELEPKPMLEEDVIAGRHAYLMDEKP